MSKESEIELETANGVSTVPNSSKKRARSERNEKVAVKKQRLENGTGEMPDTLKPAKSKMARDSTSDDKQKPKEKKARNSVSFAADTKSSSDDEPEEQQQLIITPEKRRAEKRLKREQRVKRKAQAPPPPPTDTTKDSASDAILSYLSLYHTSRSQWKFQKNRDTQLLKHALSISKVPSSYNPALATYLAGLKGTGARTRLAEAAGQAIEAQDEELKKIEGQDVEKAQFEQQVSLFQDKLGEEEADLQEEGTDGNSSLDTTWRNRVEKRKRAELVYFLMRGQLSTQKRQTPSTQKKKRKTRTAVVEDTSSSESESDSENSSSSSSDSDSDSDGDEGGVALASSTGPSHTQKDTDSDPTSSSGESSSSEESDSDSD